MIDKFICKIVCMTKTLGERIARAITEANLNSRTVSARCGVSVQAVYAWQRGDINNLRAEHLFSLSDLTGFNARWIATGEGPQISSYSTRYIGQVVRIMESLPDVVQAEASAAVERVASFAAALTTHHGPSPAPNTAENTYTKIGVQRDQPRVRQQQDDKKEHQK